MEQLDLLTMTPVSDTHLDVYKRQMRDGWEPDYEPDMEWEVIKVRSWVEDKRKLG